MKKILLSLSILGMTTTNFSQITPEEVEIRPNSKSSIRGNLNDGEFIEDLSWAWKSSVACFPATQQEGFNGKHVLYETKLPKRAILTLTLKPENKSDKMSIYAYQVGVNSDAIVPNLSSCVSCEADNNQGNKRSDNTRQINLNATTNEYKVYFAVVGENKLAKGDYTLEIQLEGGEEIEYTQEEVVVIDFPELKANGEVGVDGNLNNGVIIHDLSWAWNSSNACFPGTQQESFKGNHVLYKTSIPTRSEMEITLTPKDPKATMSLYGYQIGTSRDYLVPNLPSCVTCEADNNQSKRATDNVRKIRFNAINNPYNIFIGVAGEEGLTEGDYTLTIKLIGGETETKEQMPVVVKTAAAPEKGKTLAYTDNIKNGVLIHDLSWAWSSSNACFPGTQKESFEGKHIMFETVMEPYSTMTITLIPKNKNAELSLYGYQIGKTSNYVVPNLPRCVSCEADNNQSGKAKDNKRTIKFTAIRNPYKVVIGVAGAKGVTEGDFDIQINVEGR